MSKIKNWKNSRVDLVDVAMGRKFADTVVCQGTWVNVYSGEIIPITDFIERALRNDSTICSWIIHLYAMMSEKLCCDERSIEASLF